MPTTPSDLVPAAWLSRFERYDVVGSTNDVVAGWLREGTPEVCAAVADVQSQGRGRSGRSWSAPPGAGVLISVGFRPTWLEIGHTWRLGAVASLVMAEAAEIGAALRAGTIRLKWPNDLVAIDRESGNVRKLAGMLGETDSLGTDDARAVIGLGINVDWRRERFPAELADAMTSLTELAGRTVDREVVLYVFLERLERAVAALKAGTFPAADWSGRQLTNGTIVMLHQPDGTSETVVAEDVDTETGALLVREPGEGPGPAGDGEQRSVVVGEIHHLRLGGVM
jgi:BirA family transcriptional regulator, biotin operon repressor / biotin---[acetyl-CoA-carboxylase] ligase